MISKLKYIFPFYSEYHKLNHCKMEISYASFLKFKVFGSKTYWQPRKTCFVGMPKRLFIGKNSIVIRNNNFIQASGGVYVGDYVQFATKVSLLSSNHDLYNQNISHHKSIIIGDYCWLGMNSTILAGVTLGPRTIVANGAVVTKSFPEGMCVLAGVPAKIIKRLDSHIFEPWIYKFEFYGYIPSEVFENRPEYIIKKYLDCDYFKVENNKIVPILKDYTK